MKYRLIASAFVFLMSVPMAMASDLDDAVDFYNAMANKCTYRDLQTFENNVHNNYTFKFNSYIKSGKITRQFSEENLLYIDSKFRDEIALSDLFASADVEAHSGYRGQAGLFFISLVCANGSECVAREVATVSKVSRKFDRQSKLQVRDSRVSFCSESDAKRAAKALSDAIRLSGGKVSKY